MILEPIAYEQSEQNEPSEPIKWDDEKKQHALIAEPNKNTNVHRERQKNVKQFQQDDMCSANINEICHGTSILQTAAYERIRAEAR